MTKKKNTFKMARVKIIKQGNNPDCVHHEIISMTDTGNEVGVCKHCQQERLYVPAYQREHRRYAETT
jgi:hypothetical protein